MFVLTRKYGEVLTTHILHKSRRPKLTSYSGNLVLNGIVKQRKEITDKGKDHIELQSNLGWKGTLEEPNTAVRQNTQSSEDLFLKTNIAPTSKLISHMTTWARLSSFNITPKWKVLINAIIYSVPEEQLGDIRQVVVTLRIKWPCYLSVYAVPLKVSKSDGLFLCMLEYSRAFHIYSHIKKRAIRSIMKQECSLLLSVVCKEVHVSV